MSGQERFKKTYGGFILSITSVLMLVFSNILVRKAPFYNGFDIALLRFVFQFIILIIIAKCKNLSSFGSKEVRKLLLIRGAIGAIGMPCHFTSLKLVDPSDTISVFSCNVIIIMFMSRIYLKEKISVVQIAAVLFILSGVMLIAQPSFLIHKKSSTLTLNDTITQVRNHTEAGMSEAVMKAVGLGLAAVSGTIYALCTILIKTVTNSNTHFSIVNLYASYFGIPMTLLLSTISVTTGYMP